MEVIRFSRVQSTAGVSYHLRFADQDDLHVSEKNLLRSSVLSNALAATDEDEDHAGVFQAPTGLVRNYLVFSQRISQDEPLVNDSNNSLVLALKMFRVLPSNIVQNVMRYLQHHNIKEVFDGLPEEFHPQVVQAFFPEVEQNKSLAVECPLYIGNHVHFHDLDQSAGVHKNILNAVSKIPDMEHLTVEVGDMESVSVDHFLFSGLQNLTRLTFLRLEGPCLLKDSLPFLQALRKLELHSWMEPGLAEPGIMNAIGSLVYLETLQFYGWLEDPRQSGALLATAMRKLTGLRTLDLSVCSGEFDRWYQFPHTPEFHQGIMDGCMGSSCSATERYLTESLGCSAPDLANYVFADRVECLSLQSLCISQLTFKTTEEADGFASMLSFCKGLQYLRMDCIEINSEVAITQEPIAARLAPGFKGMSSLKTLDLCFKPFQRPADDKAMLDAYFGDDICDRGIFALSDAFETLTTLERLRFSARCSAVASDMMATALLELTRLTELDLQRLSMKRRNAESEADDDDDDDLEEDFEPEPEPFDEEAFQQLMIGDGVPDDSEDSGELVGHNGSAAAAAAALHAALLNQLDDDAADNDAAIEAAAAVHIAQEELALQNAQNACNLGAVCQACADPCVGNGAAAMSIASESAQYSLHAKETNTCTGESLDASHMSALGPSSSFADTSGAMDHAIDGEAASCSHAALGYSSASLDHPATSAGVQFNVNEGVGVVDGTAPSEPSVWPAGGLRISSQESLADVLAALAASHAQLPALASSASSLAPDTPPNAPEDLSSDTSSESSVSDSSDDAASDSGDSAADLEHAVPLGWGAAVPPPLSDTSGSDAPMYAALETTISALKRFSCLKAFKLREVGIGSNPELCVELGRALAQHSELEKLTLIGNGFCDDSLAFLLENLRGLACMNELRIIERVTFESTAALAILLPSFTSLRRLSLTHFQPMIFLNPEGAALFQALGLLSHLEVLSMSHCCLSIVAADGLSESLRVMAVLKEVNLSHNPLGNRGVSIIARALSKIPTLELAKLTDVGATLRGIKTIGWFFRRHKRIKECWVAQESLEEELQTLETKRRIQERMPWLLFFKREYGGDVDD